MSYAQRKAQSTNYATPVDYTPANTVAAPDLQASHGNSFLVQMMAEQQASEGEVPYAYSEPTMSARDMAAEMLRDDDEPAEAPKDEKIPVAHDGWKKGEGGWEQDASVKTPVSGKTKERGEEYEDEKDDASAFRGAPGNWTKRLSDKDNQECVKVSTRMMDDQEGSAHALGVKDGKVVGKDGKPLDTNDASGIGTFGQGGKGRHIYAQSKGGELRSMDPWAERQEKPIVAPPSVQDDEEVDESGYTVDENEQKDDSVLAYPPSTDAAPQQEGLYSYEAKNDEEQAPQGPVKQPVELAMANHSTLVNGEEVQGAGEIKADHGEHVVLSDRSGHYKPDNEMLYNTSRGLTDAGLAPEGLTVELTNKTAAKPKPGLQNGDLQAGALEFQSYGGSKDAEKAMRQAREDRKPVMSDIQGFDTSSLNHVEDADKSDRSAPRREKMGEQIANGDRPSLKSRMSVFGK